MAEVAYTAVTTVYRGQTRIGEAVIVDSPSRWKRAGKATITIPKSLLHGGDAMRLDRRAFEWGEEITIRVVDWKARQLGFDE